MGKGQGALERVNRSAVTAKMVKKLFIKSFGCQMNVYDSGRMADVLAPLGYESVPAPEGADMVILNTCHIREKAAEKVYSELGRLRRLKDDKGDMIIAVAGCVAPAEGEEILTRAPAVDMVCGPQSYHRLPDMLKRLEDGAANVLDTDFPVEDKFDALPKIGGTGKGKGAPAAFLTVQEGCDKFCTFCVVPYTRGAEFSRPVTKVYAEAQALAAIGTREVTLLGQNVNAYHGEGPDGRPWGLAQLIAELATIEGLDRIRYTTSHPRDMDDGLIRAHGEVEKLMPYLHLPVQSGSDRILKAMNRQHTADEYRAIVARIRGMRPDLALSSDFIVGFPGETDEDFEATLQLVRDIGYGQCFSFKYSPRPGTPGADMKDQIPEAVKTDRLAQLQALLSQQAKAFDASMVGRELDVLFEKPGRHEGQIIGRSPYLQSTHVVAPESMIGKIGRVRIISAKPNSLEGELVRSSVREVA
jgi:tRNA-2-methylthio-N6-dimethylallyladenosine synthase